MYIQIHVHISEIHFYKTIFVIKLNIFYTPRLSMNLKLKGLVKLLITDTPLTHKKLRSKAVTFCLKPWLGNPWFEIRFPHSQGSDDLLQTSKKENSWFENLSACRWILRFINLCWMFLYLKYIYTHTHTHTHMHIYPQGENLCN